MKNSKLLLLIGIFFFAFTFVIFSKPQLPATNTTNETLPTEAQTITQNINFGGEAADISENIVINDGENALDILTRSKQIATKEYSFGTLVESIEGVANGKEGRYWLYYINGEEAQVGAAEYKVQVGDVIEWRYTADEK